MENTMPLISFIVTYYNLPKDMLLACVDSVLSLPLQKNEREVIVVDDGSEVAASEILQDVETEVKIIRKKNEGPGMARNAGLELAMGEYVQFVDGDDLLLTKPYTLVIQKLRELQCDVLLFSLTRKCDNEVDVACQPITDGPSYVLNNNIFGSPCYYAFRKEIAHGLGFPPAMYHEDEFFTPQLLLRARTLLATNIPAYYYRVRMGSTMTNKTFEHRSMRLGNMQFMLLMLRNLSEEYSGKPKEALQRRVAQLTMDYIYQSIMLDHNWKRFAKRIEALKFFRFLPLPKKKYTRKYYYFTRLANVRIGLMLLFVFLPFLKKEA